MMNLCVSACVDVGSLCAICRQQMWKKIGVSNAGVRLALALASGVRGEGCFRDGWRDLM